MRTIAFLVGASALALGCGTVEDNDGGDDDGSGDGGVTNPGDLTLDIVPTAIKDETGDQIDFSTGAPIHTHAGADIALGGTDCPAVSKYSYLLDPQAPLFGSEVTANPLAWKFTASGSLTATEYRVLSAGGATTELDWTPATLGGDGNYLVELHRSGPKGIPVLDSVSQPYTIEFRVRDDAQHEVIKSACWDHRPLAAPVRFTGLTASSDADALKQFTLAANSPVSKLINAPGDVKVFTGRITHQTAEPVTIKLDISTPAVGFTKTVVTDLLTTSTTKNVDCGWTCLPKTTCEPEPASDARCSTATDPSDPQDSTTSGTLTRGDWVVTIQDGANPAAECTVSGQTATCGLPARIQGAPSKELVVVARASQLDELKPATGLVGEFTELGLTYTGHAINPSDNQFRCTLMDTAQVPSGEVFRTCRRFTTFSRLRALDNVRLDIAASALTIATAIPAKAGFPGTALAAPTYLPNGTLAGTGFVWDSGNDDLPGPQH
jgi:hypothetical protein